MNSQMEAFIAEHRLLQQGDHVLLSVSGGADSVVMTHLLYQLAKSWRLSFQVVHFHHHLRDAADDEAAFVEKLATDLNLPFCLIHLDVREYAKTHRCGLEEAGHLLRRQHLYQLAKEKEADAIALAHHANDRAETVLLNLFRGTGLDGLSALRPKEDLVIRPLLSFHKEEILAYAFETGLSFVHDASNDDVIFFRNRLRNEFMPYLERFQPQIVAHLCATADHLDEARLALQEIADCLYQRAMMLHNEKQCHLNRAVLKNESPTLIKRVLQKTAMTFRTKGRRLSEKQLEQITHLLRSEKNDKRIDCGDRLTVFIEAHGVVFTLNPLQEEEMRYDIKWDFSYPLYLDEWQGCLELVKSAECGLDAFYPGPSQSMLTVRSYRPGDCIYISGVGRKKVKKLFQEHRVPVRLRTHWPMVCDPSGEILWIPFLAHAKNAGRPDIENEKMGICIKSTNQYFLACHSAARKAKGGLE